ncbi:hypothetical protein SAMD00019534_110800 [Acytostelium subglobosum LB1]|uniref:hypothetical protein n=1 Tax=Acytostelium subglobosum LB1 TaxID=1410327 RepID=UPI000644A29D|nr:hypothetical protein SAMD00019534_110800 [Acytostelium subglobosum LB1]GAM27904.1 hypothetical protein SAMD00019534_110800 [Acytostelium subglobosum LB1]|eukprot:XP_012749187.1 hypothetical protein SAMD00019534_110800 [Acytostelium subglobosum LB1]
MGAKNSKSDFVDEAMEQAEAKPLDIKDLPVMVVLKVFYHCFQGRLPSKDYITLSTVCKQWRVFAIFSVTDIQLVPQHMQHLLMPYKPWVLDSALQSITNLMVNSTTITNVDLSNSEIDSARARIIGEGVARSTSLKHLSLNGSAMDDAAAEELADGLAVNKTLSTIDLSHNHIGPTGALAIAKSLEPSKTIGVINLSNNQIGNQGAIEITKVFGAQNKSRVKIDLSKNRIGGEGVLAIIKARQQSKHVKTSYVYTSGIKYTTVDGRCMLVASRVEA